MDTGGEPFCCRCLWIPPDSGDVYTMKRSWAFYREPSIMTRIFGLARHRALFECKGCRRFYCSTVCYQTMSVTRAQWVCRDCEVSIVQTDQVFQSSHTFFWGREAKQALKALLVIDKLYQRKGKSYLSKAFYLHYMPRHLVRNSTPEIPPAPLPLPSPLLLPELEQVRERQKEWYEEYLNSKQEDCRISKTAYLSTRPITLNME
jgi:hypothetical protein